MAPHPPRCVCVKVTKLKLFQSFSKGSRRPWFHFWELWAMTCGADVALCSWTAVNFPIAFIALVPVPSAGTHLQGMESTSWPLPAPMEQ